MFKRPEKSKPKGVPLQIQRMLFFPRGEADDTWFLAWHCQDALLVRLEVYVDSDPLARVMHALFDQMKGHKAMALSQGNLGAIFPMQLDPKADPFYLGSQAGELDWLQTWSLEEQAELLRGIVSTVWPAWAEVEALHATLPLVAANTPMRKEW